MDYMELVKKSALIGWKYRFLWLFGFFVSFADGFGGGTWWSENVDKYDRHWDFGRFDQFSFDPALIAIIVMAIIALGVIFWVLSVFSEGALIHGVYRREKNDAVGFSDCLSVGLNKFFRLFGIILVATIIAISVILMIILFLIPVYFASAIVGVLFTLFAIPIFIAVIFVVTAIEGWAIRFAIIQDRTWLDSISDAWKLFKNNLGKTIGVVLTSLISQIIIWFGLFFATCAIAIPFIAIGFIDIWLGVIPGAMVLFLIIILSQAFFGVYSSSVWTLGFMKLTGDSEISSE